MIRTRTNLSPLPTALLPALLLAAATALTGCQRPYTNYPEIPTAQTAKEDPNSPGSETAIIRAMQFVANRYTPGGPRVDATSAAEAGKVTVDYPLAISLPTGMRKSYYERIARLIGPGVVPVSQEILDAHTPPVYYVTRVWMRRTEGQVDIMRPMEELSQGTEGKPIYQTITVRLVGGGLDPWRVVHARAWEPGIDPIPEPYFVPEVERVDQFNYMKKPPPAPAEKAFWTPESGAPKPAEHTDAPAEAPSNSPKEPDDTVETPSPAPAAPDAPSGPEVAPAQPK